MSSILTPSFLIFLCILVFVVAGLIVFFESRLREQNNKISSMASLLKTLAEDMILLRNGPFDFRFNNSSSLPGLEKIDEENENDDEDVDEDVEDELIPVSDDESCDDDVNDIEEIDSEEDDGDSDDDEDQDGGDSDDDEADENEDQADENEGVIDHSIIDLDIEDEPAIKVFKLNITNEADESEPSLQESNLEDSEQEQEQSLQEDSIESELKKINIHLDEEKQTPIDFKKMTIVELRNYVTEKGLATDAGKLKKNKLLQLVGVE